MTDATENGMPTVSTRQEDVDLSPPATLARDPADAGAQPTARRPHVWNIVLIALCVLMLGAAVALVVSSAGLSTDAQHARNAAAAADHEREQVAARGHRASLGQDDLTVAVAAIGPAMTNLSSSLGDAAVAQGHVIDVQHQAVTLFNDGEISASVRLVNGAGAQAVSAMNQKLAVVHRALLQAQAAARHLQEALHG